MTATKQHLDRAEEIFFLAIDKPPHLRLDYVRQLCGGDRDLYDSIRSLLSAESLDHRILDHACDASAPDGVLPELVIGDRIGLYTIEGELGRGGMGVVYQASQHGAGSRRIALKVLAKTHAPPNLVARFVRECEVLASLKHPYFVSVQDAGEECEYLYLAMEYVDGATILDYCDTNRLSCLQRLSLFMDVCDAIQHAHDRGVLHRDIKPSNVLIKVACGVPLAKVIDFGIAKRHSHAGNDSAFKTLPGLMLGTPCYMSPEQADPLLGRLDVRADVYSLGALLYEMLVGTPPLEQKEIQELDFVQTRRLVCHPKFETPSSRYASSPNRLTLAEQRASTPSEVNQILNSGITEILRCALEPNPLRRYSCVKELMLELDRWDYRAKQSVWDRIRHEFAGLISNCSVVQDADSVLTPSEFFVCARQRAGFVGSFHREHCDSLRDCIDAMRAILIGESERGGRLRVRGPYRNSVAVDFLRMEACVSEFAKSFPAQADVFKFRYFAGFCISQTAQLLGIADSLATGYWAFSKAWLYERLNTAE